MDEASERIPGTIYAWINQKILVPVYSTVAKLIFMMAGAVVFTSISTGIFSSGSTSTCKRIGKKLFPMIPGIPEENTINI